MTFSICIRSSTIQTETCSIYGCSHAVPSRFFISFSLSLRGEQQTHVPAERERERRKIFPSSHSTPTRQRAHSARCCFSRWRAERSDGTDNNGIMRTRTAEENSLVPVLEKENESARARETEEKKKKKKAASSAVVCRRTHRKEWYNIFGMSCARFSF